MAGQVSGLFQAIGGAGSTLGSILAFGSAERARKEDRLTKAARRRLVDIAQEDVSIPRRQITATNELETKTRDLANRFVDSGPSKDRQFAQERAREFASGRDVTQLPELQAVMDRILTEGGREARGLARALKITGNDPGTSSKGRDILGRSLTDVQGRLLEAATPFLESERGRQFAAIPLIDDLARAETNEKLTQLGVGERVGAQVRQLEQLINDATFNQAMQEVEMRYQIQPALLQSAIGAPTTQPNIADRFEAANTASEAIGDIFTNIGRMGNNASSSASNN